MNISKALILQKRVGVFVYCALFLLSVLGSGTSLLWGESRGEEADAPPMPPEPTGAWIVGKEMEALCAEVQTNLGKANSFAGSFTEHKFISIFTEPVVSQGRIYLQFPHSIRMETISPYETVFLARNKALTRWEKEGETWREIKMGSPEAVLHVLEQMAFWMRGDLCNNPQVFAVSAWAGEKPGVATIRLTPIITEISQFIEAIDITLSAERDRITTLTIREANGDYTFVVYNEIIRNPELSPKLFQPGPVPWFPPVDEQTLKPAE